MGNSPAVTPQPYYIIQSALAQCFVFYFSHFPSALVPTQAPHIYSCTSKRQSDPGVLAAQHCGHIRSFSANPEQISVLQTDYESLLPILSSCLDHILHIHTPQQSFYKQSQSKLFHPCNMLTLTKRPDCSRPKYNIRKAGRFRDQL